MEDLRLGLLSGPVPYELDELAEDGTHFTIIYAVHWLLNSSPQCKFDVGCA